MPVKCVKVGVGCCRVSVWMRPARSEVVVWKRVRRVGVRWRNAECQVRCRAVAKFPYGV